MKKNFFPSYRLSLPDYLLGGSFLAFCYVSFFHGDILGVGWDSLNYLFGSPLEFYENCKKIRGGGQNMLGTPYPPSIYVIFAIWLYPFKIFGLLINPDYFPPYLVYWLKTLTTFVYAASGFVFYKITQIYSSNKDWGKYATAIWLTTPLAVFSQFIFSQYDIFYVFLTLAGFLMFLRGNILTAALFFGVAITFKYFPVFAFIPLLLLFEKKIPKVVFSFSIFLIPTLLVQYLYGHSPAFIEGVKNHGAIDRVFAASIDLGGWKIYYLFAIFTILCGVAYLSDISKERLPRTAAYIFLMATTLPFLFIIWHPQWLMFSAPAIVLTTMIDKRCDRFLILDLVGMLCFIATVSLNWQDNVDTAMFRGEILGIDFEHSYKMAKFFDFFKEQSPNVFLSGFWGYLVIQIVLKFKPAMKENYIQEEFSVEYSKVRYRFYIGLLIFIVPAFFAIYKDYTSKDHRFITNEVGGKHYGELIQTRVFEQSFIAKGSSIEEIDLLLATFARLNTGSITLKIIDSNNQAIVKVDRSVEAIKDNSWEEFNMGSVKVINGMTYRLRLTSTNGQGGNAITWWASPNDSFLDGRALIDGMPQVTDFTFKIKFFN